MAERSQDRGSSAVEHDADQAAVHRLEAATEEAYGADTETQARSGSESGTTTGAGTDWNAHKRAVGDAIGGVAGMLRHVAEQLKDGDQEGIARMLRDGASGLDRARDSLERQDADVLVNEAREYARRRPGVVVAGAAVLGFLFGRMTAPRRRG